MPKEKKSTKKQDLTNEEKEELANLTGEKNMKTPKRLNFATIKLNGSSGLFFKNENQDGEFTQTEMASKEVKGTVLKIRRVLTTHKREQGQFITLFSNEHNSWRDEIALFESSEGENKLLMKGSVPETRERFPELRVKQVLYFLPEGEKEIVKLIVRGKGLSALYDFFDEFDSDEHLFEYVISVGIQEEEGKLGVYYYNTFEKKEPVEDIKLVQEKIKEISKMIEEQEEYYKKKEEENREKYSGGNIVPKIGKSDEEIPVVEDDDEIDINEIPF